MILMFVLLLSAAWMLGQEKNAGQQNNTTIAGGQQIIHGCIYAEGSAYALRDSSGKDWQLSGDPKTLKHYSTMEVNVNAKPADGDLPTGALVMSSDTAPRQSMQITKTDVIGPCMVDPYGFMVK